MGRLSRLELENFKSYAGHQTIGPFVDFTAIIGPNGAGKSNLMDAISFVLGVRARHLRSQELKDLIYHMDGEPRTRRRASVCLVYVVSEDELAGYDEGDEIQFKRTISPAGVGSYRINHKEVTWDEYDKHLRAIGVLVKARNFLVFQGDVESIASKSPKELTLLFEQISGSEDLRAEYDRLREGKEAAEENTIFHFQKRKGVIAERKVVKEQKEEAERYNHKTRELATLKTEFFLMQLFHVEKDIAERVQEINDMAVQVEGAKDKETRVEEELGTKKKVMAKRQREAGGERRKVAELHAQLETLEPELIRLQEQLKHMKKSTAGERSEEERLEGEMEAQAAEVQLLEEDISKVEEMLQSGGGDGAGEGKGDDEDGMEVELSEEAQAEYDALREEAHTKTAALRQQLEAINLQQTADRERLDQLKASNEEMTAEQKGLQGRYEELQERERKVTQGLNTTHMDIEKAEEELEELKQTYDANVARKKELQGEFDTVVETLRAAKDDRRQDKQEVRMNECLEALKRLFPTVRGRLVDLCKPTQRKFNMAVTMAMGKHMDAIVVDDRKTGMECIEYMRAQRIGTSAFIPLDTIRVKPINERLRSLGPAFRLAVDVIDCPAELRSAVVYAVGNTVIANTLGDARNLCFGDNERVKAVTLQGGVISKSGTMTGGQTAQDADRAQRWDEKEVAVVKARREDLQRQLVELERSIAKAQGSGGVGGGVGIIKGLQNKIANLRNRETYARGDVAATVQNREGVRNNASKVDERLRELRPEIQKLEAALSSRNQQISTLENKIHKTETKLFAKFSASVGVTNIQEYETRRQQRARDAAATKGRLVEQLGKLKSKLEYEKSRDLRKPLADMRKKLANKKKSIAKVTTAWERKRQEVGEKRDEVEKRDAKYNAAKTVVDEVELEVRTIGKLRGAAHAQRMEYEKGVTSLEGTVERLRATRHELLQKARVEEVQLPKVGGGLVTGLEDLPDEDDEGGAGEEKEGDGSAMEEESPAESEFSHGASSGPSSGPSTGSTATALTHFSQAHGRTVVKDSKTAAKIDFTGLKKHRQISSTIEMERVRDSFITRIATLAQELDKVAPDLRAADKFQDIETRLRVTGEQFDKAKLDARTAANDFGAVKQKRHGLFMDTFTHVSACVDEIYKELTKSSRHPLGGTAYLTLDNEQDPFSGGIKFNAMPPMKRFRDMEQLSGGEKTVAALALLFAIQSHHPSPFFVMDEVDAALDNVNVNKVSNYMKARSSELQVIVISLKDTFYEKADGLVGICRDAATQSSRTLTLDLRDYDDDGDEEG